jgi:hypothetical protein
MWGSGVETTKTGRKKAANSVASTPGRHAAPQPSQSALQSPKKTGTVFGKISQISCKPPLPSRLKQLLHGSIAFPNSNAR